MDYERTPNGSNPSGDELPELTPRGASGMIPLMGQAGAIRLVPDAANVVVLPNGATLDDLSIRGRDLIITLDDGTVYVIPNGAVFVPEIVIDGVAVPPLNLAALLVSDE